MTNYSELVQRLRLLQEHLQDGDAGEAADAIEALEKRVQEQQEYIVQLLHTLSLPAKDRDLTIRMDKLEADLKALSEKE